MTAQSKTNLLPFKATDYSSLRTDISSPNNDATIEVIFLSLC